MPVVGDCIPLQVSHADQKCPVRNQLLAALTAAPHPSNLACCQTRTTSTWLERVQLPGGTLDNAPGEDSAKSPAKRNDTKWHLLHA